MGSGDLEHNGEMKERAVRELTVYFVLAFTITFGLGACFIFFKPQLEAVAGSLKSPQTSWPYYLAVCAPTISAAVVSFFFSGWSGVRSLFSGLFRRCRIRWALLALFTLPLSAILWALIERVVFHAASPSIDLRAILVSSPLLWLTTPQLLVDPGPWGEETGWRGFALPRLLTRMPAVPAAIFLGMIWGLWHTPAFFVSGLSQFGLNYAWFLVGSTGLTVLMTWIYVNANRNYFVAGVIPHAVSNNLPSVHAYNDLRTEALLLATIAMLLVVVFGPSLRGWRFRPALPAEAQTHKEAAPVPGIIGS